MSENWDMDNGDPCNATIDLGGRGIHLCILQRGHTGSHRHNELMAALAERGALQEKWDGSSMIGDGRGVAGMARSNAAPSAALAAAGAGRARERLAREALRGDVVNAWSFGGGVQSVAIAALVHLGRLPRPDLIVIADTGREVSTTWATVDRLREVGFDIQIAGHELATVDLYAKNGDLLIPAHTRRAGVGRLPAYCSTEWKRRVVQRWLRARGVKRATLWLGISVDEAHRMKPSSVGWLEHEYPLIDLRVRREECLRLIQSVGWPVPAKSRSWMCPYQSRSEWRALQTRDLRAAAALDAGLRERDPDVFVHRALLPLREAIEQDDGQVEMFDACDSGMCWT